jgi:plastocyanin
MNKNGIVLILVILALIIVGIVAYAMYSSPVTAPTNDANINTEMNNEAMNDGMDAAQTDQNNSQNSNIGATSSVNVNTNNAPVKSFTVTGKDFSFSPNSITVNKGDRVVINFVNAGGFHDLVIDEFNAKTPQINSGQRATIEFIADKAGTFEYYCSVGRHREMGMRGNLIVK